jgi:hypothetical protein
MDKKMKRKCHIKNCLYVVLLAVMYVAVVFAIDLYIWPNYLRNGEPAVREMMVTDAGWDEIQSAGEAFQAEVFYMYVSIGGGTLVIWIIYYLLIVFLGRKNRVLNSVNIDFAKMLLKGVPSIYGFCAMYFCLSKFYVSALLFKISNIIWIVLIGCVTLVLAIYIICVVITWVRVKVSSIKEKILGSLGYAVFAFIPPILGIYVQGTNWIKATSEIMSTLRDIASQKPIGNQYAVTQYVGLWVALVPLLPVVFLWMAMKYAAPPSIGADKSRGKMIFYHQ